MRHSTLMPSISDCLRFGGRGPALDSEIVLLRDTFTDADGTALTAHSPDVGGPWTVPSGSLTIQSNRATDGTLATMNEAVANVGQADVVLTSRAYSPNNVTRIGLFARFGATDAASWVLYYDTFGAGLYIYEDFVVQRAMAVLPYTAGKLWDMSLTVVGTSISGTVTQVDNPANTATVSFGSMASRLTNTKCGIMTYSNGGGYHDNVLAVRP